MRDVKVGCRRESTQGSEGTSLQTREQQLSSYSDFWATQDNPRDNWERLKQLQHRQRNRWAAIRQKRRVGGTGAEAGIPKLPRITERATTASRHGPCPKMPALQSRPATGLACLLLHIPQKLPLTNHGNSHFMYNTENYTFDRQKLRAMSCSAWGQRMLKSLEEWGRMTHIILEEWKAALSGRTITGAQEIKSHNLRLFALALAKQIFK